MNIPRFSEPTESYWRIHHVHTVEDVYFLPHEVRSGFIAVADLNPDVWTLSYEVEIVCGGEPEIISISGSCSSGDLYGVKGAIFAHAEAYIQEASRWDRLREDTLANGERQSAREAA